MFKKIDKNCMFDIINTKNLLDVRPFHSPLHHLLETMNCRHINKFSFFRSRYIKNLMGLSGLSVREDAVGNIFGRW